MYRNQQIIFDIATAEPVFYWRSIANTTYIYRYRGISSVAIADQFLRHLTKQDGSLYLGPLVDTELPSTLLHRMQVIDDALESVQFFVDNNILRVIRPAPPP